MLSEVGLDGGFIETAASPPEGTHVVLVISTPTAWEPLSIDAEVRWVRESVGDEGPAGFGVRFRSLTAEQASALYELLETTAAWEAKR